MDLETYGELLLAIGATVSLFLNVAAKFLGYRNSLLYGLLLSVIAGTFCTMFTSGLALAESRRDQDRILLLNLAVGLGCFSGLTSVFQGQGRQSRGSDSATGSSE